MRLALIGDIHLYRLWVAPWRMVNKRVLAMANLWLKRRWKFDPCLLPAVVERVCAIQPDMLLGAGDLTTTALDEEFADAVRELRPLLDHVPTIVVPGNHDRYTHAATWRRVMERHLPQAVPAHFPLLRPLTPQWSLLALNASRPRALTARGQLGAAQLDEAGKLMAALPNGQDLVILCHYPPVLPPGERDGSTHRLDEARQVCDLLRAFPGRVLFLHGHIHRPWCWRAEAVGLERVVLVNAGAPCRKSPEFPRGQGFWQIELPDLPNSAPKLLHHYPEPVATPDVSTPGGDRASDLRLQASGGAPSTHANGWRTQSYL